MTDFENQPLDQAHEKPQANVLGLSPEIYEKLKKMAHAHLQSYRSGMTLNSTALVHEVFLKLNDHATQFNDNTDRNHLLSVASLAMRHILVDYARLKKAGKRGAGALHLTLQESLLAADQPSVDLLELDMALDKLARRDPELEKLVVLRFFAGLTTIQVAEVMSRSTRSIERDWTRARTYLFRDLKAGG